MLNCWSELEGYREFVEEKWRSFEVQGWGAYVLKEKLKLLKVHLKEWHKAHCANLPIQIEKLKEEINKLELKGENAASSIEEINTKREVTSQLHKLSRLNCSIMWQRSRMRWIKEGDANSNFFHRCLLNRRKSNEIGCIEVNGSKLEGVEEIKQKNRGARIDSLNLVAEFTEEEIKKAVWDCESSKSPGPDGINFGFIKEFWDLIKDDFLRFMAEFHCNGRLVRGVNSAFIALIPKIDNPVRLNDFRPISLIGCMYKVLAKVLANRLKVVIQKVIAASQFAFMENRQMVDNVLIMNELVDDAKRKKREALVFKVDFEKAYD